MSRFGNGDGDGDGEWGNRLKHRVLKHYIEAEDDDSTMKMKMTKTKMMKVAIN
jgi:hypothetical protein